MKKIIAICLSCIIALSCFNINIISTSALPLSSSTSNSPLSSEIIIDESSIVYVTDSSSGVIGQENILYNGRGYPIIDDSYLEFVLRFNLSNNFSSATRYKLRIADAENDIVILNKEYTASETVELDNIILEKRYSINLSIYYGDNTERRFAGRFVCALDVDNTAFVDMYLNEAILQPITRSVVTETESNDTPQAAYLIDPLPFANTVQGNISSSSDVDYFKLVLPETGYLNFTLTVPENKNYDLHIYSQGLSLFSSGTSGTGVDESVQLYLSSAVILYIKVSGVSGSYGSDYYLNVNFRPAKSWYSQISVNTATYDSWNTEYLDNLYLSGSSKPFMVNNRNKTTSTDFMSQGCALASIAMVLRNMNAFIEGEDFRTGFVGGMIADPYTVMLANNSKDGSEVTYSNGKYNIVAPYNISITSSRIAQNFYVSAYNTSIEEVHCQVYNNVTYLSGTESQKATAIANALSSNSEGVVIKFQNSYGNTHFIAFVGDNGSDYSIAERFIVCDPGTSMPDKGSNVALSSCYSYGTGTYKYTLADAIRIISFDYESPI